jgi:hypothetical protein
LVGEVAAFGKSYRVRARRRVDDGEESADSWRVEFAPIGGGEPVALVLRPAETDAAYQATHVGRTGLAGRRCKVRGWWTPGTARPQLRIVVVDREGA